MNTSNKPNALPEEILNQVAGGWAPEPVDPTGPTDIWTETNDIPIELGNRAVGCPRSGCNQKAMKYDGSYSINVAGSWKSCYTFSCKNCGINYAKTKDENPVWYVKL